VSTRRLLVGAESWPLSRPFRISRGVKFAAEVVVVEAHDGAHRGLGEAVPYGRYGETVDSVSAQIASVAAAFVAGMTRAELQRELPPGAARNALDCALWDLEAKQAERSVAELAGVRAPAELVTAVTISLDSPTRMAEAAERVANAPLIKIKVDADAPLDAVKAVRAAAPDSRLIVDPNESWSVDLLQALLPGLVELDIALLEQPIPVENDAALSGLRPEVPICADEAAHVGADLERIAGRYQAVNIKLDKTGGLTEALAMVGRAREMGLIVMVGCMVSTSLSIAPALLLAGAAAFIDLDGPWWLARDRESAMRYEGGRLFPPRRGWGAPL
jgi:L-alanine-DL-glutamate epimerase-like enolase superfamily enzyme